MSLSKYNKKRDFTKTAEPTGEDETAKGKTLRFVIQKHDASHLHYDFRLEMEGVLKSWAVPKGPSTDPKVKRLAMMVEDHPYSYRNFEGIIPQGEYGGGTVIIWDEGTYEPIEDIKGKKAQENHLLKELKKGSVKVRLKGKKLQGEFALVKTQGMAENAWLLIKHKDEYASSDDITKKDKSVISGQTIEKVEKTSDNIYGQEKKSKAKTAPSGKKKQKSNVEILESEVEDGVEDNEPTASSVLAKGKKAKFPAAYKPMLATLVDEPFDDEGWLYEVKWDGYRAMAFMNEGDVEILSRNKKSFNDKFYPIHKLLKDSGLNAVLDGEIMVLNDKGLSDFGTLQNWRSEADGNLVFYAFDILWFDGKDLQHLPLTERRAVLEEVLPVDDDRLRISKVFNVSGTDFFAAAEKMEMEGIMAKKADSTYSANARSREWLKIKIHRRQEVIIGGYTRNEGTSKNFSSLLLGVYEGKKLKYVGKVGTGFSDKLQKTMLAQFKKLEQKESPFDIVPDYNKPSRFRPNPPKANATWLKPELVCEVKFTEVTSDGVFRHPSFQGLREDKSAKDVVLEKEIPAEEIIQEDEPELLKSKAVKAPKSKSRKTLLNPTNETQVRKINGHDIKFTHLSKVYWPDDGVTKRDMFNYYYQIAEFILPYLKDRPQSLNRFPGGITSKGFYQKDVKGKAPSWAETFPYTSGGEQKEYLVGDNEATLMWMATLGCIELNPWFSRVKTPDNPDYCVIDLDPDKHTFDQVIEAALVTKKVLDAIDVPSFCKTSGSTGIHIYIPLNAKYSYDQSQMFAKMVVSIVNKEIPDFTSLERMVANRKGKMYLDFLQNRPGATIACPYSLRPKPGATVSMPLAWDEVKPGLKMSDFTIHNSVDRVRSEGDHFKGVLGKGVDLEKIIRKAKSTFE